MERKVLVHNIEETKRLANRVASLVQEGYVITMSGDLGAGKTTFTKYLGKALGVKKTINSPTFTILKEYKGVMPIYHIDAYRLEGVMQDLGFEDLFEGDGLCVVEWPSFLEYCLPNERIEIEIKRLKDESREFCIRTIGDKYTSVWEGLE